MSISLNGTQPLRGEIASTKKWVWEGILQISLHRWVMLSPSLIQCPSHAPLQLCDTVCVHVHTILLAWEPFLGDVTTWRHAKRSFEVTWHTWASVAVLGTYWNAQSRSYHRTMSYMISWRMRTIAGSSEWLAQSINRGVYSCSAMRPCYHNYRGQ